MKRKYIVLTLTTTLLMITSVLLTGCGGAAEKTASVTPAPTAAVVTEAPASANPLVGNWSCEGVGQLKFGTDGSLLALNVTDGSRESLTYTLEFAPDNDKKITLKLGSGENQTIMMKDKDTFVINDMTYTRDTGASAKTLEELQALAIGKWSDSEGNSMELKKDGKILFIQDGKKTTDTYTIQAVPGTPTGIAITISDREPEIFVFDNDDTLSADSLLLTRVK